MSKLSYLSKVLAALILHSYQNYALCFTSRFPLFHSRLMEWSEEHDVHFLREMLARNVFGTKKGSPARAQLAFVVIGAPHFADRDDSWTVVMNYPPWLYTSRRCNNCHVCH